MRTVSEIVDAFGGTTEFAQAIGTTQQNVTNMKARNSIPSRFWKSVALCAEARGIAGVTLAALADLHSLRPAPAPEAAA